MSFRDKDKEFQKVVVDALYERYIINANKGSGELHFQPIYEDLTTPRVEISPEEIKKETGRNKIRNVILDEYIEGFNQFHGIKAELTPNHKISISLQQERKKSNEFSSLSDLEKQNKKDLADDPELGDYNF